MIITFDEAFDVVMSTVLPKNVEHVPLAASMNRILARDVVSDINMPPFNKSAMDGYACRREDLKNEMVVVEYIPAGYEPKKAIHSNECAKIMTGAVVPEGADCVIMIEHTRETESGKMVFLNEDTKDNICLEAEDIKVGDTVLEKGSRIRPEHIAVLATVGCTNPLVASCPQVGIIATGSELVDPDRVPGAAFIRNSNSWQLAAQVERMGCIANNYGIVIDTVEALDAIIKRGIAENDVIILSGGVSKGDFDLVPDVLEDNGIELIFDQVAIKPGRPSTFGTGDNVRCFGLPGNPVSTFLQFEMLVKPFLYKMMGHPFHPTVIKSELCTDLKIRRHDRVSVVPVRFIASDRVGIVDYHGSAHINAMCVTDGVFCVPVGVSEIKKGSLIDVRLL